MSFIPVSRRHCLTLGVLCGAMIVFFCLSAPTHHRVYALDHHSAADGGKGDRDSKRGKRKQRHADMSELPPDESAEKRELDSLGDGFRLRRTNHYSILYNTSEKDVKVFSSAIEKTYRSCVNYTQRLGFDAQVPSHKLLIYYFDEHPEYSGYSEKLGNGPREQSTPGVYFPLLNRSMFYNFQNQETFKRAREEAEARIDDLRAQLRRPGVSRDQRRDIGRQIAEARKQATRSATVGSDVSESIVQHEVAHQVLWNIGFHNPKNFVANPRWFVEGTAMMFEPISTGSSANFGAVNTTRLDEYKRLLAEQRLIPVKDFISTADHFATKIDVAYPQSWALIHYLNRTKRSRIRKYVELINKRPADYSPSPQQELADFEKVFGRLDENWVESWLKWMARVR